MGRPRSWEQIRLTGIGERRMAHVAANLDRLPLRDVEPQELRRAA